MIMNKTVAKFLLINASTLFLLDPSVEATPTSGQPTSTPEENFERSVDDGPRLRHPFPESPQFPPVTQQPTIRPRFQDHGGLNIARCTRIGGASEARRITTEKIEYRRLN